MGIDPLLLSRRQLPSKQSIRSISLSLQVINTCNKLLHIIHYNTIELQFRWGMIGQCVLCKPPRSDSRECCQSRWFQPTGWVPKAASSRCFRSKKGPIEMFVQTWTWMCNNVHTYKYIDIEWYRHIFTTCRCAVCLLSFSVTFSFPIMIHFWTPLAGGFYANPAGKALRIVGHHSLVPSYAGRVLTCTNSIQYCYSCTSGRVPHPVVEQLWRQ